MSKQAETYDYVIIGSGFGGSVSALRLSEKGYKVLVIEFIDALCPDDYMDAKIIEHLQINFDIQIP